VDTSVIRSKGRFLRDPTRVSSNGSTATNKTHQPTGTTVAAAAATDAVVVTATAPTAGNNGSNNTSITSSTKGKANEQQQQQNLKFSFRRSDNSVTTISYVDWMSTKQVLRVKCPKDWKCEWQPLLTMNGTVVLAIEIFRLFKLPVEYPVRGAASTPTTTVSAVRGAPVTGGTYNNINNNATPGSAGAQQRPPPPNLTPMPPQLIQPQPTQHQQQQRPPPQLLRPLPQRDAFKGKAARSSPKTPFNVRVLSECARASPLSRPSVILQTPVIMNK